MRSLLLLLSLLCFLPASLHAQGFELRVGAPPLQHALVKQLFSAPDGRFYLRGNRTSQCYLYAQHPQLGFRGNRIVLELQLEGKLGRVFGGECVGVHWSGNGDLSMLPEAQGAIIGFTDVRLEHLTGDSGLDRLLGPLVTALAPRTFHVDAGTLISKMLRGASERSGTAITLQHLSITGMQVAGNALQLFAQGLVEVQ